MRSIPVLSIAALILLALSAPVQAGDSATARYVGGGVVILGVGVGNMVPPTLDHTLVEPASVITVFAVDDVYGQAPLTACVHQADALWCEGPLVGGYVFVGGGVDRVQVWVHAVFVSDGLDAGLGSLGSVTATFT